MRTALFLCAAPLALLAQPAPKFTSVSPEWIQRGTTGEITFTGENLGNVTRFLFSGEPGLSATNATPPAPPRPAITIEASGGGITQAQPAPPKDDKKLVARVTAAPDAPLGAREVRVVTPGGVSNPLLLNVGQWPELTEAEPNNAATQAQAITLPAAITGSIGTAQDADAFRFKAGQGQQLLFEVDAARRGTKLDASLAVLDAAGKELARNEDRFGLDSLLDFTVPEDGEYVLQLRDFRYQGGGDYGYRLYAGALPYVDSIFPFGGQRGKTVEVALDGRNLEGTTKMTWSIAASAPRGRQEIRASTPRGYSNKVAFDVSDLPDFLEAEPNDAPDKANAVSAPVVINGRVSPAKDADQFKFKSDKDQKLVCEVAASRFGSPLDALLVLADASGSVLQQNDDANGADARIEFDAKKDAEYVLAVRDLTGRGGDKFAYRLSIRPPGSGGAEAGFVARFLPDTLRVHRHGAAKVRCEVTRTGGFDGPVRCEFADLPAGVTAEPLVLPNAPASGLLLVSAGKDAPLGSFPVKLNASATIGGKLVTRTAEPLSGDKPAREAFLTVLDAAPFTLDVLTLAADLEQGQTTTLAVLANRREGFTGEIKLAAEGFMAGRDPLTKSFEAGDVTLKPTETTGKLTLKPKMDSEVGTRTLVVRGEAAVDGAPVVTYSRPLPLTVTQFPFLISSTLARLNVTALPAGAESAAKETASTIKVERRAGFNGDVTLALEGLPAGLNLTLDKIPAGLGETTLKLVATEKAPPGTNTLTVIGTGVHNDKTYRHRASVTLTINAPEPTEQPAKPVAAGSTAATEPK
jgi:hypothetical protein